MEPSEIQQETVASLQETVVRMNSLEFDTALGQQPPDLALRARKERQRVQYARLALENAQLAAIRDQLLAHDAPLAQGRQQVAAALQNLQRVEDVVNTVASFVDIVGRVVALV